MMRPRLYALLSLLLMATASHPLPASSQEPAEAEGGARPSAVPARFVRIEEPITDETTTRVRSGVLAFLAEANARPPGPDGKKAEPIVVFEFLAGDQAPGASRPGVAGDLARFLVEELNRDERTRVRTLAFVPKPLSGYATLPVLSCDEVVMGPDATLGKITPEGKSVDESARALLREIATRKRREPELALFLGMLDPEAEVHRVKTADGQVHYVLVPDLDAFKKDHAVAEDAPAWEAGNRGVLTPEMVRGGLVRRVAEDRGAIRRAYGLDSTADLLAIEAESGELVLDGPITRGVADAARRYLGEQARKGTGRVFVRVNSPGGEERATGLIVEALLELKGVETVAYVEGEALGLAALVPLACDKIVFKQDARMGDMTKAITGANATEEIDEESVALKAEEIARAKGHPPVIARAMVDSRAIVVQARDGQTGAVVALLETDVKPGRHTIQGTIKPPGVVLTLTADDARALGLATQVVKSDEELWSSYGLKRAPKSARATWVDNLVSTLNSPWMSGLLLFIGLFMLILELKLPGVGLPAILSALAFLLFFWSHYLGGTADQLEILLFLVGVVCLALELFVFPGFAVFGLSGILLILVSVIMASHTFIWPSQEYEYREMGHTLMEVTGAILTVSIGAIVLGRYFPSLPLFRRMILVPEPIGGSEIPGMGKPPADGEFSLFFLLGETGLTTTALKPTGKARFGEMLVDVSADGFYVEPGATVEVVEVQGSKVIVKRV